MAENGLDTSAVEKKNTKVVKTGRLLAIIVIAIGTCWLYVEDPGYFSYPGLVVLLFRTILICVASILGVVFINVFIREEFKSLANRNVEISGVKAGIFYAFEIILGLIPFLIEWLRFK